MRRLSMALAGTAVVVALAACGGDGGDEEVGNHTDGTLTSIDLDRLELPPATKSTSTEQSSSARSFAEDDPEYKLAVIDGRSPTEDEITPYASVLDSLQQKCDDTRPQLGDYAVASARILAENGHPTTVLDMLRQAARSIPTGTPVMPCADIFASLVVLQTG